MRVLCFAENFNFITYRLFLGFVSKLNKFCEFKVYCKKKYDEEHTHYKTPKHLIFKEYDSKITAKDLKEEFNPDVFLIILHNKSVIEWIPKDIHNVGVPTVILEDDHYEYTEESIKYKGREVLDYYKNNDITLLLRRHYYKTKVDVPSIWFPQSVNEEEFQPYYGERENSIGFAGSFGVTPWYQIRRNAMEQLGRAKLLPPEYGKFEPQDYPRYIKHFKGILGCSGGILHTPLAKMFECMMSNTPYMTNWFYGKHVLFGIKEYCFTYKDDCSDVVDKARIILNDKDYVDEVTKNALGIVQEKHTDKIRIQELYEILQCVVSGGTIPNKWGN